MNIPASVAFEPARPEAQALRTALDGWLATNRVAGLQYLLLQHGAPRFEHHAGWADVAQARPVTAATTFNLYSITKPFTAAGVLLLAQRQQFDLAMPIAQATALPGLARLGSVGDTLVHRGGFGNPLPLRWCHLADDDPRFDERAFVRDVLDRQAARAPSSPRYSNPGYLALGVAIERATGQPFRDALRHEVLAALPLDADDRLGFALDPAVHARGHLRRRSVLNLLLGWLVERQRYVEAVHDSWLTLRPHHVDGSAYGGLIGNAGGLARFGQALLGGHEPFAPALAAAMLAPAPGTRPARSPALVLGTLHGHTWAGHAGGGLGAYGEFRVYPALGAVSVLLTNRPGFRDEALLDRFDRLWLSRPHP